MRLPDVAVECLQVKLQLPEMARLKFVNLELECDQAVERAIEEKQVKREVASSNLERILASDKAKVAAQFDQELFEPFDKSVFQFRFGVFVRKVEEFHEIAVFEDVRGAWMGNCHRR